MKTCLPLLRRVNCCLILAAMFFLPPCFADTNPTAITLEESIPAETAEIASSVTNALGSAITHPPSTAVNPQPAIRNPQPAINAPTNVAGSFLRVMAMLALVLALFLGGVWLFRNWQRLTLGRGQAPKLNILETRSLGGRHALFVVGYENERFLVASSPAGINMLTHLQSADAPATDDKPAAPQPTFASTLAQVLKGKTS